MLLRSSMAYIPTQWLEVNWKSNGLSYNDERIRFSFTIFQMWALVVVLDSLQAGKVKRCPAYIVRLFLRIQPTNLSCFSLRYICFPRTCTFAAVGLLLNPLFLEDPEGSPLFLSCIRIQFIKRRLIHRGNLFADWDVAFLAVEYVFDEWIRSTKSRSCGKDSWTVEDLHDEERLYRIFVEKSMDLGISMGICYRKGLYLGNVENVDIDTVQIHE